MIIGQSIYNVPPITKLLLIVEYQLKCCSVADDAAPDSHMFWSGAACCRQGHQWVAWSAARQCHGQHFEHVLTKPRTSLFYWFYCFITLLILSVWHALKLLLALQGTVATCEARFGGLSNVKALLKNSAGMCLLKIIKMDSTWQTCCTL